MAHPLHPGPEASFCAILRAIPGPPLPNMAHKTAQSPRESPVNFNIIPHQKFRAKSFPTHTRGACADDPQHPSSRLANSAPSPPLLSCVMARASGPLTPRHLTVRTPSGASFREFPWIITRTALLTSGNHLEARLITTPALANSVDRSDQHQECPARSD